MNLDVLKTLITVIERGSITAAARQLGISQPAVSMQIASLEEDFGTKLLKRTAYGVELTEAGKQVLLFSEKVHSLLSETKESVANSEGVIRGSINIAASNIPGMFILPKLVNDFRRLYPQVNIDLEIMNSRRAIDMLISGDVHIAAIGEDVANERVVAHKLIDDEVILIAPANFETDKIKSIVDIISYKVPVLRRKEGSSTRHIVDKLIKEANLNIDSLNVVGLFNSVIPQVNAVAEGLGLAFVSKQAIKKELSLNQIKLVFLEGLPIKRRLNLVFKDKQFRNRVEEAFYQMYLGNLSEKV